MIRPDRELQLARSIFKLHKQKRLNFCETVYKVFGRYGEKAYLYSENKEEIIKKIFSALNQASKEELTECYSLLFSIMVDLDEKKVLKLLEVLIDKIDLRDIKSAIEKLYSDGIIAWDYFSKIEKDFSNISERELAKILYVLESIMPEEVKIVFLRRLKNATDFMARQWYYILRVKDLKPGEVDDILLDIETKLPLALDSEDEASLVFEYILIAHILSPRLTNEKKGILDELLKKNTLKILRKLKVLDERVIDKPFGESLFWFVSKISDRARYEDIESLLSQLVKLQVIENLEVIPEILEKTKGYKDEKMYKTAIKLSRSKNWNLRLLSLYFFTKLSSKKEFYIKHVAKFCRDRRSIIRKICSEFLVEFLKKREKANPFLTESILSSRNTKAIANLLESLRKIEADNKTLISTLKKALSLPRMAIYEKALELLSQRWSSFEVNDLVYIIEKIYKFSSNKKRLRSSLDRLIKTIIKETKEEKVRNAMLKILDGSEIKTSEQTKNKNKGV